MFKYSAFILTEILLIPYLGWGVYLLRRRLRFQDELSSIIEGLTLLGVLLFCALEFAMLRVWLAADSLGFLFALLGVMVSAAALYGHIAVSFLSKLIVNTLAPEDEGRGDRPRLGPAESLERQGDYDGALQEYLVLARIYPQAAVVHLRAAENLIRLGRFAEAPAWYQRALKTASSPVDALPVLYRLCELYEGQLASPEKVDLALAAFVDRFPTSDEARLVRERRGQSGKAQIKPVASALESLDAEPWTDAPEEKLDLSPPEIGLESMDNVPSQAAVKVEMDDIAAPPEVSENEVEPEWKLEPLEHPVAKAGEPEPLPESKVRIKLEAMEDAPKPRGE